jgi:hypothetical protein
MVLWDKWSPRSCYDHHAEAGFAAHALGKARRAVWQGGGSPRTMSLYATRFLAKRTQAFQFVKTLRAGDKETGASIRFLC